MKCANCAFLASDDFAFCPKCGTRLAPAARAEPSARALGVGPRRHKTRIASLRAPERARAGVGPREH